MYIKFILKFSTFIPAIFNDINIVNNSNENKAHHCNNYDFLIYTLNFFAIIILYVFINNYIINNLPYIHSSFPS